MSNLVLKQSFSFLKPQDWNWDVTSAFSNVIIITDSIHTQIFTGTFTYPSETTIAGTVSGTTYQEFGSTVYFVTGMSDSAAILANFAKTKGDTQATYAYVLRGNDAISGSIGNDILLGYNGNDSINGGAGADKMIGGLGNDTYYIDNIGDVVTESSALLTEIDKVNSTITYTLGANLERLTLIGTGIINGTGNALNNTLNGNAAANSLNGLAGNDVINGGGGNDIVIGGAGKDNLIGGLGNDTYYIDNIGDVVTESSALLTEIDTVNSAITYTLGANLERLTLIGTGIINGTGNALNNTLNGNAAANSLNGLAGNDVINGGGGNDIVIGGAGKDMLTGGLGNDRFDFNAYSEMGIGLTRDVITDFVRGQDKVDLSTIDPNAALVGNQAFTFIAAATAFSIAGQVRYSAGIIAINTDIDAATEYEIQLTGVIPAALAATDFVL